MEYSSNGLWAVLVSIAVYFFYTYFKGKYSKGAFWIAIACFASALIFLYEAWSLDVLKEDIEMGVYYIVIIIILLMAGKITFIWRSKKRKKKAWKKFTNDDDDDYGKFLKEQREKYLKDNK